MCLSKGEKDLERFLEIKGKNFLERKGGDFIRKILERKKGGDLLERFYKEKRREFY